jgi:hypothetical protein
MRQFRVLKNRSWAPAINLDKVWSLVTEKHREAYKDKTDVAPVIDVVRAVRLKLFHDKFFRARLLLSIRFVFSGLPQGFGQGCPTEAASDRQSQVLFALGRGEDQERRRRLRFSCINNRNNFVSILFCCMQIKFRSFATKKRNSQFFLFSCFSLLKFRITKKFDFYLNTTDGILLSQFT